MSIYSPLVLTFVLTITVTTAITVIIIPRPRIGMRKTDTKQNKTRRAGARKSTVFFIADDNAEIRC